MDCFEKIVHDWKQLKRLKRSILDIWQGCEYASGDSPYESNSTINLWEIDATRSNIKSQVKCNSHSIKC